MLSSRKPITTLDAAKLGLSASELADPAVEVVDLYIPEQPKHAEMIEGETAQDRARALARRLRELNVI